MKGTPSDLARGEMHFHEIRTIQGDWEKSDSEKAILNEIFIDCWWKSGSSLA